MGRVWRIKDSWAAQTGAEVQIFSETLSSSFCSGQNLPSYIISRTPMQSLVVTPPSRMPLTQILEDTLLAYRLHNAHDHTYF